MKHDLLTLTDSLILQKDVDDLVRLRHNYPGAILVWV